MLLALIAIGCALSTRKGRGADPPAPAWPREALGLLAFAGALLSKESTVAVPAIVSAATWLYAPRAWRRDLAWWALALAWALPFALVLRGLGGSADTGYAYDVSPFGIARRTAGYVLMFANSSVDRHDSSGVPELVARLTHSAWTAAPLLLAGLALLALFARARSLGNAPTREGARGLAFGAAWFVAASAPFVVLEDRLFLRYSVLGNAGLALVLVSMAAALFEWRALSAPREAAAGATDPTTAPAPP